MIKWKRYCCEVAKTQLEYHCDQHGYSCPDKVLWYSVGSRKFSLKSANATYGADFCPWCGRNLIDFCIVEDAHPVNVNRITPETCKVYLNGEFFAEVNEYEFNDLRIQIKNTKSIGFAVEFEGQRHQIGEDGRFHWPRGLFDVLSTQLNDLLF